MRTTEGRDQLLARLAQLPRFRLAHLPTPLDDCPRLAQELGIARLLLKRDDATGLAFGGNKVRKLEFTLGAALAEGCDILVHGLATQSNYCRQAAAAAARAGLRCVLLLRKDHKAGDYPQGNLLLDYLLGATVQFVDPEEQELSKERLCQELRAEGHRPYLIGYQDEVLGAVAYILCVVELEQQLAQMGVTPDWVCITSGHGTQAGLLLGVNTLGLDWRIMGFSFAPVAEVPTEFGIRRIFGDAADLLGLSVKLDSSEVRNTDAYAGPAYGVVTDACRDAIKLVAQTEGILLDPVYTGKGFAGLVDLAQRRQIGSDEVVVFVHTGGTPALFAYNREVRPADET